MEPTRCPISWEDIVRDFFGYDPEEQEEKKQVESILNNPLMQQSMVMAALKKYGHEEVLQMIQSGQLGGMQQPASPNVGTQGRSFQDYNRGKMNTGQNRTEEMGNAEDIESNIGRG